jgi:putative transposase
MISLAHKIRLYPNQEALRYLAKSAGTSRFAYNWALARWKKRYRDGEKPTVNRLNAEFNARKGNEFPWTSEVSKYCCQQAILDLGDAFKRFFEHLTRYPKFKKKGRSKDSFYLANDALKVSGKYLKLPKLLQPIKMAQKVRFPGKIQSCTVSRDSCGDWYASFSMAIPEAKSKRSTENPKPYEYPNKCENQAFVGVDLGIKTLATYSYESGCMKVPNPRPLARAQRKLRRSQRSFAKKLKGSNNRLKSKLLVARIHRRVRRIRLDSIHKLTKWLVKTFRWIGIEDLNVRGMVKNRKLARALADASFGEIRRQLQYKAALSGSFVVVADRWFPSSKKCSDCGITKQRLDLSEREWSCPRCGTNHDRDTNAALNLRFVAERYSETLNACGETVSPNPHERVGLVSLKQVSDSSEFSLGT